MVGLPVDHLQNDLSKRHEADIPLLSKEDDGHDGIINDANAIIDID